MKKCLVCFFLLLLLLASCKTYTIKKARENIVTPVYDSLPETRYRVLSNTEEPVEEKLEEQVKEEIEEETKTIDETIEEDVVAVDETELVIEEEAEIVEEDIKNKTITGNLFFDKITG